MTTTYWSGNGQATAQVVALAVTAVSPGGTLTASLNGKSVVYVCITGDTTSTAAAGWAALLSSATAPAEMQEMSYPVVANVISVTANVPGTPFAGVTGNGLTSSGGGGATVTQTTTVANVSPNDVNNASNWLRSGSPSLPQNGDDVVLSNSAISLLWNLDLLSSIQFNSFQRFQDFTGAIGLPENNPNGYFEWRQTYFKFGSFVANLPVWLGLGNGSGPSRERYNAGANRVTLNVVASGSPADAFAVRFLGTHVSNALNINGTSVAVAMLPGEVSTIATANVDGGGSLSLGQGVTATTVAFNNGTGFVACSATTLTAVQRSSVTVQENSLTFTTVTEKDGSRLTWLAGGTITTLNLQTGSVFDKSGNYSALTITNSNMDGDTTQLLDPLGTITYSTAIAVRNAVNSGPFTFSAGRTVQIT